MHVDTRAYENIQAKKVHQDTCRMGGNTVKFIGFSKVIYLQSELSILPPK